MNRLYQLAQSHGVACRRNLHIPERILSAKVMVGGVACEMHRIQHNSTFGPYKGGIRVHTGTTLADVIQLSETMTLKNTLFRLPFGGGKGLIRCERPVDTSALMRAYGTAFENYLGEELDVPAPDIGTQAADMDALSDHLHALTGRRWNCTGKTVGPGGGYQHRRRATGTGCAEVLVEWSRVSNVPLHGKTFSMQGYGNVGSVLAQELCARGMTLVCVSDHGGSAVSSSLAGLSVEMLDRRMREQGTVADPASDHGQWLRVPCDVLIPAAVGQSIARSCVDDVRRSGCMVILEAANNAVTADAESELQRCKVTVLPDMLCNAGGVIASYFEYRQNRTGIVPDDHEPQSRI